MSLRAFDMSNKYYLLTYLFTSCHTVVEQASLVEIIDPGFRYQRVQAHYNT